MIDFIQNIDSEVFLFFNSSHNSFFDSFMSLYSGRFIWIPMYAALLFVMLKRYPTAKVLLLLLGITLSIVLADQVCSSVIRPVCQRLRPSNLANPLSEFTHIVNGYRGGAYGFPSCHAANSFALAIFAATMLKKRSFTIFIIGWAVVNSYSRIYLGVHYPGDLIIGGIIGCLIGYLCCKLAVISYDRLSANGTLKQSRPVLVSAPAFIDSKHYNAMEIIGAITILAIILVSTAKTIA